MGGSRLTFIPIKLYFPKAIAGVLTCHHSRLQESTIYYTILMITVYILKTKFTTGIYVNKGRLPVKEKDKRRKIIVLIGQYFLI